MKKPDPIDVHVGARVRLRRKSLGMSQGKLGKALGLTFQQIQKYERGANRIGSSRLYRISRILDVPLAFFFDELSQEILDDAEASVLPGEKFEAERLARQETLELVRAYYRIPDDKVRKRIFEATKAIGKSI